MRQSESAVSTAPTTTRRGGGTSASAKSRPPSSSSIGLVALGGDRLLRPRRRSRPPSSSGASPRTPSSVTNSVLARVRRRRSRSRARRARPASPSRRSARPRPRSRRRRRGRRPRPRRRRCRRRASFGGPPASTLCASSTTAPSTQPPETEPAISPREPTANLAPSGRGAERRVRTTVASATSSPRVRQRSAVRSVSSFMRCDRSVPARGDARAVVDLLQHVGQRLQRAQVVAGQEVVDVRQRGLHARHQRAVALAARPAGSSRRRGGPPGAGAASRSASSVGIAALPAVGGDHDDRAAGQPAPAPDVVEGLEVLADARAAGPVGHGARGVARARGRGRARPGAA